jgi:hypothetical protein
MFLLGAGTIVISDVTIANVLAQRGIGGDANDFFGGRDWRGFEPARQSSSTPMQW